MNRNGVCPTTASGDVLIVGAGPVGLVMALLLSHHGVRVRIVDRSREPVSQSRATDLHPGTLERLDAYGVSPLLVEIGQKIHRINVTVNGNHVGQYSVGRRVSNYPFGLTVPQCTTEAVLQQLLADRGIAVERGLECVGVIPKSGGAVVQLQSQSGCLAERHADWVISCEGASSSIRQSLDIAFPGQTSDGVFAVADLQVDLPFDRSEMHLHINKRGGVHVLPMPVDGYVRLFLDQWNGDSGRTPPTDELLDQTARRLGLASIEPLHTRWASSFRVHRRVASRYRSGRFILAGDAAHVCTPVGGQGLNLGVADACAIAPAVAAMLRGQTTVPSVDAVLAARRKAAIRTCVASWVAMRLNSASGIAAMTRDAVAPTLFPLTKKPVTGWLSGAIV